MSHVALLTFRFDRDSTSVDLARRCPWCGRRALVQLDADRVARWNGGALVQEVWPELDVDSREVIVSGSCAACFGEDVA